MSNQSGHPLFVGSSRSCVARRSRGGIVISALFIALVASLSTHASAEHHLFERPPAFLPTPVIQKGLVVGDFNLDGHEDLVTTSQFDDPFAKVTVLLGTGDGAFVPGPQFPLSVNNTTSLQAGDLNGDDKLDLIVGTRPFPPPALILVLLGNGDGSFGEEAAYEVGGTPVSIAIDDLDGNGSPDVVVANQGRIAVLMGIGDGTFEEAIKLSVGNDPNKVMVADFNQDGDSDLMIGTRRPVIFIGAGDGTFEEGKRFNACCSFATVADINLDDVTDVVLYDRFGGLSVRFGVGDGTFRGSALAQEMGQDIVFADDMNSDGLVDLVEGPMTNSSGTLRVSFGRRFGQTFSFTSGSIYRAGNSPAEPIGGDFDEDGNRDLVVINASSDPTTRGVSVLLNRIKFADTTTTTVSGSYLRSRDRIKLVGQVNPRHRGHPVRIHVFKRADGEWVKAFRDVVFLRGNGGFRFVPFQRVNANRCQVEAKFPGDEDHAPSSATDAFRC